MNCSFYICKHCEEKEVVCEECQERFLDHRKDFEEFEKHYDEEVSENDKLLCFC